MAIDYTQYNNLTVMTNLNCAKRVINKLTGLSFLYDPNWYAISGELSLPIATFNVIEQRELSQNEISTKRIILYNNGSNSSEVLTTGIDPSRSQVVSDNIINKPRVYKIQAVVPFGLFGNVASDISNMASAKVLAAGFNSDLSAVVSDTVTSILSASDSVVSAISTLSTAIAALDESDSTSLLSSAETVLSSILSSSLSVSDFNKTSIQRMADNRSVLIMKDWASWTKKYVVISDVDFSKKGTEDNVYRCNLTLQEFPILTLNNVTAETKSLSTAAVSKTTTVSALTKTFNSAYFTEGEALG